METTIRKHNKTAAIVLAAGSGKRMQSDVKKQYLLLNGKPLIYYALETFQRSFIDEIILVAAPGEVTYCKEEIVARYGFTKVAAIVEGGKERYHSVYHGIQAISDCDYLFIHDGARPLITEEILKRGYRAVQNTYACVTGMPVKDTIKIANEKGEITVTPNRDLIWMIQTPQIFAYSLIKEAYERLIEQEHTLEERGIKITDDAMVVETFAGHKIKLVEGSYLNIKITTPEDLGIAEVFLNKR